MNSKKPCVTCNYDQLITLLNTKEQTNLRKHCNNVTYKKGDNIFRQNMPSDFIIYVNSGLIKIEKSINNEAHFIFKILKGPAYIGISSAFGKSSFNYSAYALNDTKICMIEKQWFTEMLENNGKFAKKLFEIHCVEETESTNRILTLFRKQVPGRMADVMLFFSKDIFQSDEFDFPLSRDELANYIGVSRKSFIRTLSEFKNDKLISVEGKKIKIIREDLLYMLSRIG